MKVVRELVLERHETVQFLSIVGFKGRTARSSSEMTQHSSSRTSPTQKSPIRTFHSILLYMFSEKNFFDRPRTWILYEPMGRDKSLLLAMTSSVVEASRQKRSSELGRRPFMVWSND